MAPCAFTFTGTEALEQMQLEGNIQVLDQEPENSGNEGDNSDNLEQSASSSQTGNVHIQRDWLPALKGRFDEIVARWSQRKQVWTKSILELLNFK